MLVFVNLGGTSSQWYVGPLLMLVPMLLSGGLLELVRDLSYALLTPVLSLFGLLPQQQTTQQQQHGRQTPGGRHPLPEDEDWLLSLINVGILVVGVITITKLIRWAHRNGGWRGVWRLLLTGAAGGNAAQHRHGQQRGQQQPRHTIDDIASVLQKLPMEEHATQAELEAMSAAQLKERLARRGVDVGAGAFLEKKELLDKLLTDGGSSADCCGICYEDYASGDAVRVLPCRHRFHIECVDRWFLSSTDYSRAPACPMCNAELLTAAAGARAADHGHRH